MKSIYILLISLGLAFTAAAQPNPAFTQVDQKVLQLPRQEKMSVEKLSAFVAQFKTPQEKVRAIYVWLADNVAYDVSALNLTPPLGMSKKLVENTITSKKAICQGYAETFLELCARAGINAYFVDGYTKQQGRVDYTPHAWCAAQLDGEWYFFDPTWGAGYVTSNRFVKKLNENFFMVAPSAMIKSHYPFDPLWQLSSSPLKSKEFQTATPQPKPRTSFHFLDTLAAYEAANAHERLASTVRRMEAHGADNPMLQKQLQHFKEGVDIANFNSLTDSFNHGIDQLNRFIQHRNNQQLTKKKEQELTNLIASTVDTLQQTQQRFAATRWYTKSPNITQFRQNLDKAVAEAVAQKNYVTRFYNPFSSVKKR